LVWPGVSPDALDGLSRLENTQVALGLGEPPAHKQEFFVFAGQHLTVATGSVAATYPGLFANGGGGAIVTHPDYLNDTAARQAVACFEQRWQEATPLDAGVRAELKVR